MSQTPETTYAVILKEARHAPSLFEGPADDVIDWLRNQTDIGKFEIWSPEGLHYATVGQFLVMQNAKKNVVPKFYVMNPATEDLIGDGSNLANGMKVLFGDSNFRAKAKELDEDWMRDRVMTRNRWCTVSELKVIGTNVSFVGVYDDGTKSKRSVSTMVPWLVKKDSIPDSTAKYNEIMNIIKVAFDAAEEYAYKRREGDKNAPSVDTVIENATKAILGILG